MSLFVAAYETRSFTAAARREHATQSGVSQHIRNLEQRHGTKLFVREGGGMRPTGAADIFYRHCVTALLAIEEACAALRAPADDLSGTASIGLMPTLTAAALAPALLEFRARYPNARVSVVEGFSNKLTEQALAGELDFAIVPAAVPVRGLRIQHFITTDEMFVSRRQGADDPVELNVFSESAPLRLVLPEAGNIRSATIRTFLAARGAVIAEEMEIDSMMAALDLVAQSDWCAIFPALMLASRELRMALSIRPITPPLRLELVSIEAARLGSSPVALAFRDYLSRACHALLDHAAKV